MKKKLSLVLLLFLFQCVKAQSVLEKPDKYYSVVDKVSVLKTDEYNALSSKLDAFKVKTGNELVVVIIDSCGSLPIDEYANKLFNSWGIGQKEQNNGILLLIAYKDHKVRIENGYGVEAVFTDADAAQILDSELKPLFRESMYYDGINNTVDAIISKLDKGANHDKFIVKKRTFSLDIDTRIVFFIVLFAQLFLGLVVFRFSKKSKKIQAEYRTNIILTRIFVVYLIIGFIIATLTKSRNYEGMNLVFIFSFLVLCLYYLSYLISKALNLELIRIIVSLFYGFLCSLILYYFIQFVLIKFGIFYFGKLMDYVFIGLAILLSALLFFLFKTKKLDLSSFIPSGDGSSGGGSGGSGGGGYGGGSSGGGGASGRW